VLCCDVTEATFGHSVAILGKWRQTALPVADPYNCWTVLEPDVSFSAAIGERPGIDVRVNVSGAKTPTTLPALAFSSILYSVFKKRLRMFLDRPEAWRWYDADETLRLCRRWYRSYRPGEPGTDRQHSHTVLLSQAFVEGIPQPMRHGLRREVHYRCVPNSHNLRRNLFCGKPLNVANAGR